VRRTRVAPLLLVLLGAVAVALLTRSHGHPGPSAPPKSVDRQVGQLITATYSGTVPPPSILSAVRAGKVGAIILMGDNTGGSVTVTRRATRSLQQAARAGGNPGLLIMTDQEGGEVKRLNGPPAYAAAQMGDPALAERQGYATAQLLRRAGINLDLAPVADVTVVNGFMTTEKRTFGNRSAAVASAACAFASGLARGGVAYTLKHFPGLGDAIPSTDVRPVAISEPAAQIDADDAAYRRCGHGRLAVVMVSSASYTQLTGRLPAVLSPVTYQRLLPGDGVSALTISDTLQSGAIQPWPGAARRAIAAGLDVVMYPGTESGALTAYRQLLSAVHEGRLSRARVAAAAARVLALKRALGLA